MVDAVGAASCSCRYKPISIDTAIRLTCKSFGIFLECRGTHRDRKATVDVCVEDIGMQDNLTKDQITSQMETKGTIQTNVEKLIFLAWRWKSISFPLSTLARLSIAFFRLPNIAEHYWHHPSPRAHAGAVSCHCDKKTRGWRGFSARVRLVCHLLSVLLHVSRVLTEGPNNPHTQSKIGRDSGVSFLLSIPPHLKDTLPVHQESFSHLPDSFYYYLITLTWAPR